ncbi:hypothetical protein KUTeg_008014 [Tegillarca granosa]|uniref:Anoctamin n=1 Tax=Tegillarca granosa TaxID=220873 RepID=A0ABQ9FEW7_TEGGR|nr:hypothetical protein KUTeg_008014 [Tegillarca granosa]
MIVVVQYGFITIFVAAFPLAPLFALINNIIEIRLDAYKFVTQWKRPLAERAQDIGIWFGILRGISAIAVVSNAVIIAFTSEFIKKLVYMYGHNPNMTMHGYVNFSLSVFNVSDFQERSIPDANAMAKFEGGAGTETCRYRGFREPPGSPNQYEYTMAWWHVLAGRLAFIVVFENLVVFATWLIMYLIPDMPAAVKLQMLRENFLAKEALYSAETVKSSKKDQNGGENAQPLHY